MELARSSSAIPLLGARWCSALVGAARARRRESNVAVEPG